MKTTKMILKIGSRKSRLAIWQSELIAQRLQDAHPGLKTQIVTMDTLGDQRRDIPLPAIGAKGLFTAELEEALLSDQIDLAVHSLKDLPSQLPDGLIFAGSPKRAAPTDSLITTRFNSLEDLPQGATIATGSRRRRAQLLHFRPDLQFVDLRGNIGTRLKKLVDLGYDGIIMATAALDRLQITDQLTVELPPEKFVPAVGQGAIGVEIRQGRADVEKLLHPIFDPETVAAVRAERHFMSLLDGGCSVALGAYCQRTDDHWTFHGWASSSDGKQALIDSTRGPDPNTLANQMAKDFLSRGANEILRS